MASIVGIICEYNPFHKGHLYQIEQIRKEIPDAIIIAIMSGNVVQRGEFAMFDKYDRARAAIECGVNAVFEIPYPYAGSTAEIFANAGVEIAYCLGCEYLYFGSENGDVKMLEAVACAVDSSEFEEKIKIEIINKDSSYIVAKERALRSMGIDLPQGSNDMLGVEYIRAIRKRNFDLKYRTIVRVGADHNDTKLCEIMSASAIRNVFYEKGELLSVPDDAKRIYDELTQKGSYIDDDRVKLLMHTHAALYDYMLDEVFDSSKEIKALISEAASRSQSSQEFFENLSSKTYTVSRLKRVLMYSMLGVYTLEKNVGFTLLLAMDEKGQEQLNKVKKRKKICIVTKHSDSKGLSHRAKQFLELVYKVDEIHKLLLNRQQAPLEAYKKIPIIKK